MLNWKIRSDVIAETNSSFDEIYLQYISTLKSPDTGFFHLPQNQELLQQTKIVFEKFNQKKYFIHIGIGGSALGPEMLIKSLGCKTDVDFIFLNNIDPDDFHRQLKNVNLKESLIYIVSKSGTTAETVAAMSILISLLKKVGISDDQFKDYFVFCTDPTKGDLRKIAEMWNITTLPVPSSVGGRFSVLTPVALLPVMFAGLNAEKLLEGAGNIQSILSSKKEGQSFFNLAYWIKDLHDKGISQTVVMPYSSLLKEFSPWFVQLWAESLGKEGKGLTPIPAYGATDQHSQMQLFMEGPRDKALFLIEVKKFNVDYSLENNVPASAFKLLSPFSLATLMKAEFEGTLKALEENKRHVVHFSIPELNENTLGQLILFSECLTCLVGILLKVDPFSQPGVEAGKKYAHEWLKSHS
jgi:glucose-6-phosphate isomerase